MVFPQKGQVMKIEIVEMKIDRKNSSGTGPGKLKIRQAKREMNTTQKRSRTRLYRLNAISFK
jgi:hypothetical protein